MRLKIKNKKILKFTTSMFILLFLGIFLVNCAGTTPTPIAQKTGAELWGETCSTCHAMRSPANLTDAEWEVAVTHMRTRANLTAVEAEKILEFLKASN